MGESEKIDVIEMPDLTPEERRKTAEQHGENGEACPSAYLQGPDLIAYRTGLEAFCLVHDIVLPEINNIAQMLSFLAGYGSVSGKEYPEQFKAEEPEFFAAGVAVAKKKQELSTS